MSVMTVETIINPLVQRQIFPTPVDAARALVQDYVRRQLRHYEKQISRFEKRYKMNWAQFTAYTTERTTMLRQTDLTEAQRHTLHQAIMQEEDDWLDWKVALEMRQSWQTMLAETISMAP